VLQADAVVFLPDLWPNTAKLTATLLRPGQQASVVDSHREDAITAIATEGVLFLNDNAIQRKHKGNFVKLVDVYFAVAVRQWKELCVSSIKKGKCAGFTRIDS